MADSQQAPDWDIEGEIKFRFSPPQIIVATITALVAVIFSISTLTNSREAVHQAKILTDAETPAASIIFTQRESLVYLTRYAEYLAGGVDRRTVQIARALLAQRLSVIDGDGSSIATRIDPDFLSALKRSDEILASGPPGILPVAHRAEELAEAKPVIDQLALSARTLIVSYQHAVDQQIQALATSRERAAKRNLALLLTLLTLIALLFIWLVYSARNQLQQIRQKIRHENLSLIETQQELSSTRDSLAQMQSLNEAKNEFIATVNHELRTPLTSITGFIDLIRTRIERGMKSEEIAPLVETLDRNAGSLLDLVESMLSISQLESADFRTDFNKLDLYENLTAAIFVLEPELERAGIKAELSGAKDQFIIDGNYAQISQVCINIISNAIKFSPADSTISISLERFAKSGSGRFIRVRIADQGIGIPSEDVDKLFTRFFRASNAVSGQKPGTGLGLAIVQKIAFLHGGDVSIDSTLGAGTIVTIELPEAISNTDQLVEVRRLPVLERSLQRLRTSNREQFADTAHEIGGAIGFYGFESEGEQILAISRSLHNSIQPTPQRIDELRTQSISLLERAIEAVQRHSDFTVNEDKSSQNNPQREVSK